jgi:hypothetical protein
MPKRNVKERRKRAREFKRLVQVHGRAPNTGLLSKRTTAPPFFPGQEAQENGTKDNRAQEKN